MNRGKYGVRNYGRIDRSPSQLVAESLRWCGRKDQTGVGSALIVAQCDPSHQSNATCKQFILKNKSNNDSQYWLPFVEHPANVNTR